MTVFRKWKMLERLAKEGRAGEISREAMDIMNNLDGCEAIRSCFRRVVYQEPVMWVFGKDGNGNYVNEKDCEEVQNG